jgi:hypothetical protein
VYVFLIGGNTPETKSPKMKLTIQYAAGHSATETDLSDILSVVREQYPDAVAYTASGDDVETNAGLTPGVDVLIWDNEAASYNDGGRRAIARVSVSAE